MRPRIQWRSIIAVLLGALVFQVGCTAPPAAPPAGKPAAQPPAASSSPQPAPTTAQQPAANRQPATIKIMTWSQEQAGFYKDVAAEFKKESPWVTLDFQTLEQGKYREALPLMFQSNQAPDIFFWTVDASRVLTMGEVADLGWIRPLAPDGKVPDSWKARWPEGVFVDGINMSKGAVYSFPFNDTKIWGPGYMFYNKAVFKKAGLDPDKPPQTWNQFLEAARTIKQKAGAYALAAPLKGTDFQRPWYAMAGSIMSDRFFDYRNGRFDLDDPRMLKVFAFIQNLYKEGLVVPGVEDKDFSRRALATGQAAIYFDGAWVPGNLATMGFKDVELGVAPPPYPDDGTRGSFAQGFTENKFFISSQTKHPEEAWLFIEWMTRPDGFFAREYLKRGFGTLAFADNAKYITDPGMLEVIKASNGLRVTYPEPLLACQDLAKSKAFMNAENLRRDWEFQVMVEALTSGKDLAPVAADLASKKNAKFNQTLEAEKAKGLNVSVEQCYRFPEWDGVTDYKPADYAKRK